MPWKQKKVTRLDLAAFGIAMLLLVSAIGAMWLAGVDPFNRVDRTADASVRDALVAACEFDSGGREAVREEQGDRTEAFRFLLNYVGTPEAMAILAKIETVDPPTLTCTQLVDEQLRR